MKSIQHKRTVNLPAADLEGPAKIPRNFGSGAMLKAATAALHRRGAATHPWNGRRTKKP